MGLIRDYTTGDYAVTQYSGGGSVRDRLTREIVAEYTDFWTKDGSVHPKTKEQIDLIYSRLGIKIEL